MKLIAHRGKIDKHDISNSKLSILKALGKPYVDGIECDVRLTKDLEVVVIHDPVIDFVSNGTGIVKQMTLKQLKKYRYGNDSFSEPVLTLKQLLRSIHSDKLILIELKDHDERLVQAVHRIINKFSKLHIIVISFSSSLLVSFQDINPRVETGLLIGYFLNQDKLENDFDYNLFSFHYLDQIDMDKKLMYFNINEKEKLEKIVKKRNDICIITDCASQFELMRLFPH